MKKKDAFLGVHMSIAKGLANALYEAQKIKANTIQIFTKNQRSWREKEISAKEISLFEKAKKETNISIVTSHCSYLINLGSSKKELLEKSKKAFIQEIKRCLALGIDYLVFHPGSFIGQEEKACLDTICQSLLSFKNLFKKNSKLQLLLENTAGQGSNVGYKFEHLAYIIKNTKSLPMGVCFDTCHAFAAGYDIVTKKGFDDTLKEFDKIVGLKYLKAFHLNDSSKELGSRKDRHANIGEGKIGLESFKFLLNLKRFEKTPKYLETPLRGANELNIFKKLIR